MKYSTLVKIHESISEDLKAAEIELENARAALNLVDPDCRMKSGELVEAKIKAAERVFDISLTALMAETGEP